jgi:hypothetical protein
MATYRDLSLRPDRFKSTSGLPTNRAKPAGRAVSDTPFVACIANSPSPDRDQSLGIFGQDRFRGEMLHAERR